MVQTVPAASSSDADAADMAATAAAAGRRTSSDGIAGADDGGGDSALSEPMLLFPFMLHVGVVLIITWVTSVFSIKSLFFLVMSFIYLHWVEKQGREREQRWIRHEERRKAHVAGLGDGETVRWLNRAITSMWPVCLESFSSQQFLMPIAPWFFNSYKPWGVSKVLLQKLHLGNRAPIFTLIRALDQTSDGDHLVMEAAMEFASGDDMSAEMLVALHQWFGGFRTTFYISKLHIEGKVKIAVKFVDGWPVIGRIRFCFAHPPYIQMTASPLYKGGIDVTYFPGADRWLEATLAAALEQSLLEPNMLVVNLEMLANSAAFLNPRAEQAVASTHDNKSPPIAMVNVKVLDAKNLRIADRNGFSDPYVKVSLGLHSKKTAVKKKNLNPIWNEEFQFIISSWDLPNILILHVLDKDFAFFHDSLGSCMVHVSNYRDGEWHEENLDLEMTQHKKKKKVGQLHFAIMVEECITQTFDDNPSVGGVSSQPGTRELYMNGNAESTQSSPASTSMFMRSLNTDLPPANNNSPPGDQKQKGKTSHSRSSSASGPETQTTMMPPESQAREGEVIDIIDVPIGPRGTFTILHPGKLSPRNWPSQNPGHMRRGKGTSQEKVEYEGSEGRRRNKRYHNRRRSAGASQESLPAVEKESEQSVSSMEHSRELELLCAPERNGTVMFILEPNTTPIQSLASDELPPEMSIHPPTLTPILSNQERADLEDEDDEKTQTVELTPNGTHFTRPHHDEDDVIMDSQNETTPPKSKKGGWWEKAAQRMRHKQKTHLDTTTTKKDQVVNSPELIEYSDEFDNGEAANYSSMQLPEEDEPLIHEDEKKIINSTQSRRGSSLRNISEKTWAKLGLGPKKP